MKQKFLKNVYGVSLVELVVVMGIMGAMAAGLMSMMDNQNKAMKGMEYKSETFLMAEGIRQLLASAPNCSRNFGPLRGTPLSPTTSNSLTQLLNNVGPTVIYQTNVDYSGMLRISSITFGDPASYAGPHPSPSTFIVPLVIHFSPKGKIMGQADRVRTININVMTDASGKVAACSSTSMAQSTFVSESLTANGYVEFPNGLIMQWGSGSVGNDSTVTVNYPRPFPNQAFSVTAGGYQGGLNSSRTQPMVRSISNSTFVVGNGTSSTNSFWWYAIGK